jgi:hypothetical protein
VPTKAKPWDRKISTFPASVTPSGNTVHRLPGLFVGQHLHHRTDPGMQPALLEVAFGFYDVFEVQAGEFFLEFGQGHHQFDDRRAAGAVL